MSPWFVFISICITAGKLLACIWQNDVKPKQQKPLKNLFTFLLILASTFSHAQLIGNYLPPEIPWAGKSLSLVKPKADKWVTPAEKSDFIFTASRTETFEFFEKLAKFSKLVSFKEAGKSKGGLSIPVVVVSSDATFHQKPNNKKPILLVQCGIHAGEIDGKDAAMMLIRDIVTEKAELIKKVNLLVVPILNVEGHERISIYNRMNQRGPNNMGWRTNGKNLNLNRDYIKVETGGIQTVINLINAYKPSLYFDVHVTDGADYQYDITYGFMGNHGYSPNISNWLAQELRQTIDKDLQDFGHIPGPLLFAKNGKTFVDGNLDYTFNPDFSHAYGDVIHLPTVLVENHSLKPFRQRVLGTYVLMESALKLLADKAKGLEIAVDKDKNSEKTQFLTNWTFDAKSQSSATNPWDSDKNSAKTSETQLHLGIASETVTSPVTGATYTKFTGEKITYQMSVFRNDMPLDTVILPKAYIIPANQDDLIERIKLHGFAYKTILKDTLITANSYRLKNPKFATTPFEGRIKVTATPESIEATRSIPAGSIIIRNDNPKFVLAAVMLEPQSPSSLFQWGFMNHIFNRTEYAEQYVMEPYMQQIILSNSEIKAAFEEQMKDKTFAENPNKISSWFYNNSPFVDGAYLQYPVLRVF